MAIQTLTRAGIAQAVTSHPENTKRKAVSLAIQDTKTATHKVTSLGGAELTTAQVLAQFQAHWTLLRKQSGEYENAYSAKIVAECKRILDTQGVVKTNGKLVRTAK